MTAASPPAVPTLDTVAAAHLAAALGPAEHARLLSHRRKVRAVGLLFAGPLAAGLGAFGLNAIGAPVLALAIAVLAIVPAFLIALSLVVVHAIRESRALREIKRLAAGLTPDDLPLLVPSAGDQIGAHIVLESTPDSLHVARTSSAAFILANRAAYLAAGAAAIALWAYAIATYGPTLAGVGGGSARGVLVIWMAPLLGLGAIGFALASTPIQWIASRQERRLSIERLALFRRRSAIVIEAADVAGFELSLPELRIRTRAERLYRLLHLGTVAGNGRSLGDRTATNIHRTICTWRARSVAAAIMLLLTDSPDANVTVGNLQSLKSFVERQEAKQAAPSD